MTAIDAVARAPHSLKSRFPLLDAIGSPRRVAPSVAAAAVGALGASSGAPAPRNDTAASRLTHQISEAARADCRRAHAQMGLLAIPALALDALRDTGCKW
ncbi:hypothetical protein [Burkholderia singularis]|uniref:Uncharacterized protein n=1 Tax=Burkholderia singularis TaxID=1503053 RepID=A0A238H5P6_9BURK|nr:hypothetical protein [Burkholderia singularis]SMG00505.1 hypothetical protein BSIN_3635 [Burkholderia singularis]